MTHATDNDNISPENAEPPNKKASKSGSRENTAYLKTVLHWKKDLTIDLGYKLSKLEGGGCQDSGKGDHNIDTLIHFFQFIFTFQVAKIFTLI